MKRLSLPILIATLIVFSAMSESHAQWVRTNGPCGGSGSVYSMAADNLNIFAASGGDIYRSTDKGKSWSRVYTINGSIINISSLSIARSTIYAGTYGSGAEGTYPGPGLLQSSDSGASWFADTTDNSRPFTIWTVTAFDSVVLASSTFGYGAGGMFRSTDQGTHWARVRPSGVTDYAVEDSSVFAAVSNQGIDGFGVYFSSDRGATWSPTSLANTAMVSVAVKGSIVLAGGDSSIHRSTDNGTTWSTAFVTLSQVNAIVIGPSGSITCAGTDSGVYRSTDLGMTWARANSGITSVPVYSLLVVPSVNADSPYVFAGTGGGIFRSTDNGMTWNASGLPNHQFPTRMSLSSDDIRIFAGAGYARNSTSVPFHNVSPGFSINPDPATVLFVSTDDGVSWHESDLGIAGKHAELTSLCTNGSSIVAGTSGGDFYPTPYVGGAFLSTDSGGSWSYSSSGLNSLNVYALTAFGSDIIAGTASGGVDVSTNMGVSWSAADSGLFDPCVLALATSGSNWVAGTLVGSGVFHNVYHNDVFFSPNDGANWSKIDSQGTSGGLYITCVATGGNSVIVGTGNMIKNNDLYNSWLPTGGIYRIVFDGQKWSRTDSGLAGNCVTALASTGHYAFAGTYTNGIFSSSNDGVTWQPISEGLTDMSVASVGIKGTNLFAATSSGVWKRPLSEVMSVSRPIGAMPHSIVLEQNFPNPFNPSTSIQYALPRRSQVTLSIYNTLGQLVTTLVNGEEEAGYHEVKFDGRGLASGVYFYRLQAGSYMKTMKAVILR